MTTCKISGHSGWKQKSLLLRVFRKPATFSGGENGQLWNGGPNQKILLYRPPQSGGSNGQWWYFQVKILKFLLTWLLRGLQEILLRGLVAKNFTLLTPSKWGVKWPMVMFLDQNSKIFTNRVGKKSSLDGPISTLLNFLPIIKLFWLCPIAKSELLSWYPIFWNILRPIFRLFRRRIFY